jgi:hypothetical protein
LGGGHNKIVSSGPGYDVLDSGHGMCLFFTRKCLDAIQGYDEAFGIYGYEHSDISRRAKAAGFCGNESFPYITPHETTKYLYSLDFDHGWKLGQPHTSLGQFDFVFSTSIHPDEPIKEYLDISSKNWNKTSK